MAENSIQSTTQEYLDIHDITNDLVIMKDGTTSLILSVDAMNFGLLAEEEQDSIIYAYAGLLNSLNYPIQVIVRSQTKDVTTYLRLLKDQEQEANSPENRQRIRRYREFVSNLIHERNVLDKKFYVSIPAGPLELGLLSADSVIPGRQTFDVTSVERSVLLEKAKNILEPKRDHLVSQFARIGLNSRQLTTQEIIQYFYVSYNPEAAEGQEIADSNSYSTPLVKASFEGFAMAQQNNQNNQPTPQNNAGEPQNNAQVSGQQPQPASQPQSAPPQQPAQTQQSAPPQQPAQAQQAQQPTQQTQVPQSPNQQPLGTADSANQPDAGNSTTGETATSQPAGNQPMTNMSGAGVQPPTTNSSGMAQPSSKNLGVNPQAAATPPNENLPDKNQAQKNIPVENETIKKPQEAEKSTQVGTPSENQVDGNEKSGEITLPPNQDQPVSNQKPTTDQAVNQENSQAADQSGKQEAAEENNKDTEVDAAQEELNKTVGELGSNPAQPPVQPPQSANQPASNPNTPAVDTKPEEEGGGAESGKGKVNNDDGDGSDNPPPIPEIS